MKKPKFEHLDKTLGGYEVKDLRWLETDNIIVGLVKDPLLGKPELRDGFVSCQWNKYGLPIKFNKGRNELILEISK